MSRSSGLDRNRRVSTQLAHEGPSAGVTSRPEDLSRSPAVCGAAPVPPASLMTSRTCARAAASAVCSCSEPAPVSLFRRGFQALALLKMPHS